MTYYGINYKHRESTQYDHILVVNKGLIKKEFSRLIDDSWGCIIIHTPKYIKDTMDCGYYRVTKITKEAAFLELL